MNISSGDSCATPFWQTDDIRLGVVGAGHTPGERSLSVLLSCGAGPLHEALWGTPGVEQHQAIARALFFPRGAP